MNEPVARVPVRSLPEAVNHLVVGAYQDNHCEDTIRPYAPRESSSLYI